MKAWEERPHELASLLNPAFLGILVIRAVAGYAQESGTGLPFPLLFVALPVVLHRATRERLPRSIKTKMNAWLQESPEVRVGFAERVNALSPYVREAICFAMSNESLRVQGDGTLEVTSSSLARRQIAGQGADEANDCLRSATFIGRWLASAGSTSTIFANWGIRP